MSRNIEFKKSQKLTVFYTTTIFFFVVALLEKFTWLLTEKARDGKYPHSTGKFTDTMRVKDQIEYFDFYFSSFFLSKYNGTLLDLVNID
jgi:hypothetical protein